MIVRDFNENDIEYDEDGYDDDGDFFEQKSDDIMSNDGDINMSTLHSYIHNQQEQQESFDDHDYRSMTSSPEKSLKSMSMSGHSHSMVSDQVPRNLSFGGEIFVHIYISSHITPHHIISHFFCIINIHFY